MTEQRLPDERAAPACRTPEHRSTDWALDGDRTWACGICQPPSRGLVKARLAVYRNSCPPATAAAEGLSPAEVDRLSELEQVVERGVQTFVEVGNALAEIRDQRLYRAEHATFEGYCRERWSMGRSHAYRMIDAAEVVKAVSPIGDIDPPSSEAVVRELVPIRRDPEQMREVWTRTVREHGPKPTARQVRVTVADLGTRREERQADERYERIKQDKLVITLIGLAVGRVLAVRHAEAEILAALERTWEHDPTWVISRVAALAEMRDDLDRIIEPGLALLDDIGQDQVAAQRRARTGGTPTT